MKLDDFTDHLVEAAKAFARTFPPVAVLGAYMVGLMQLLTPVLQFAILVLTTVLVIYQIRVQRKRLAEKKPGVEE